MTPDPPGIGLEPRTISNCLDLAVRYTGRRLGSLLALWLLIALPVCCTLCLLMIFLELDLRVAAAVTYLGSVPLGGLLVQGAVPELAGKRLTFRRTVATAHLPLLRALLVATLNRAVVACGPAVFLYKPSWSSFALGLVLFLFPGCWLAVRSGFVFERTCLPRLERRRHARRIRELITGSFRHLFDAVFRVNLFCVLLWIVLVTTLEFVLDLLLQVSFIWSPLKQLWADGGFQFGVRSDFFQFFEFAVDYLLHSPGVATMLCAVGLLVYVIGRLGWFFCYLDARVRQDCWDIEMRFVQSAERLQGVEWA